MCFVFIETPNARLCTFTGPDLAHGGMFSFQGAVFPSDGDASGLLWTSPMSGIPAGGQQRDDLWSWLLPNSDAFSHGRGDIGGGVSLCFPAGEARCGDRKAEVLPA